MDPSPHRLPPSFSRGRSYAPSYGTSNYSSPGAIYTTPIVSNVPIGVSYSNRSLAIKDKPPSPSARRRILDDYSESSSSGIYSTGGSRYRSSRLTQEASPTSSQSSKLTRRIDSFLRTSEQTIDRVSRRPTTSRYVLPDSPDLSLSLSARGPAHRSTSAASIAVKAGKHLEALISPKKLTGTGGSTSESLDNLDSDSDESLDISDDTSADLSKVMRNINCGVFSKHILLLIVTTCH